MARLKLGIKLGAARNSLDDLNDSLTHGDETEEEDPWLQDIEGTAT